MMSEKRKKMSNWKFRAILIPVIVVVLVLAVAVNIAGYLFTPFMDDWTGRGERHAIIPEGRENWDTDYYEERYPNAEASRTAAYELALEVQSEGTILLKNNGVLPLAAGSTVTPFGARYRNPIFGQTGPSGSAKWTVDPTYPEAGLKNTYTINTAAIDAMPSGEPTRVGQAPGTLTAGSSGDWFAHSSYLYEHPASVYESASIQQGSTALVFIGREGSEGSDKKLDGYTDGTPHYFALSQNEKDTIAFAKAKCSKLVVILQACSAMEIPELTSGPSEADAILLFGHAGEKGYEVLGDILSGKINPSGRTVAVWASDFTKDPTYQNFGDFQYTNQVNANYGRYYVEYDEGMYMGYRYYETAYDIKAANFNYGKLSAAGAVTEAGAVTYPFGYGLSYTSFTQSIRAYSDGGDNIEMTVRVTNTGTKAGKEVVQLYYNPPYDAAFDGTRKIEKPTKTLIAFAKTDSIAAGGYEDIRLSFVKEEMASYCYTRENPDGTKGCYVMSSGDYVVSLQKNSHDIIDSRTWKNSAVIWFDNTNPRKSEIAAQSALDNNGNSLNHPASGRDDAYKAATNLYQESNEYMQRDGRIFTRTDWTGTFPVIETEGANLAAGRRGGKTLSEESLKYFEGNIYTFDVETDPLFGNVEGSIAYHKEKPVSKADNGLTLSDLRGKSYYDQAWDEWLDQIDYDNAVVLQQMVDVSILANYATTKVDSLGIPLAQHSDGANGLKVFKTNYGMNLSATYGLTPLWAATFNTKLMEKLGDMLGQEALKNNISGWYAPAMNLHRSPFAGRNFEYYSEDPVLTGKVASAVVSGAGKSGLYCYMKHFAMNDQETRRNNFLATWATEQTMREIYFRAYEIPFKEAMMTIKYTVDANGNLATKTMRAATATMATQSCIGQYYAHADYRLLTEMLRGEWGFAGTVTSDMFSMMDRYPQAFDRTFRSGCDTFLPGGRANMVDRTSASAQHMLRRIMHNVGYTVVHSNAMQGIAPGTIFYHDMSPWVIWLIVGDVATGLVLLGMIAWIILRGVDEKKYPGKYVRRGKNEN